MATGSNKLSKHPVGVIGAGSFGTSVANLLALRNNVLIYARNPDVVKEINTHHRAEGYRVHKSVRATESTEEIAGACELLYAAVPSGNFREMMQRISPFLHPYHMMIHCTKGLEITTRMRGVDWHDWELTREDIRTMSEVIRDESVIVRLGCLAGPNLARELHEGKPAATVVASHFDEVISAGQRTLRSDRFQVYGNKDLVGIELTGVLKNIIAIASGILYGLGLGENAKGLLISRGMVEMIHIGKLMGGNVQAFIGLAGIGDLVATCNSVNSRNFTVGNYLAQGKDLEEINRLMEEVAEGINTVKIVRKLLEQTNLRAPITEIIYKILYEGLPVQEAVHMLMKVAYRTDVDFL